jgi:hypothetical protein
MHVCLRIALVAVVLVLSVLVMAGAQDAQPPDDLKAAVDKMITAFEEGTYDDLEAMTADEIGVVLGFPPEAEVVTAQRWDFLNELRNVGKIQVDDESVQISRMGAAATARAIVTVPMGGAETKASTELILVQQGGKWMLRGLIAGPAA